MAKSKTVDTRDLFGEHLIDKKFTNKELEELEYKIRRARTILLRQQPFYAVLAIKMEIRFDPKIRTACVDGRTMTFSPGFVELLTEQELIWLICHEVLHVCWEHMFRCGNRIPIVWNYAGDYVINLILEREHIGTRIKDTLYDQKYTNMITEDVYELLKKEIAEELKCCGIYGNGGKGEPQSDGHNGQKRDEKGKSGGKSDKSNDTGSEKKSGSARRIGNRITIDVHINYGQGDSDGDGVGDNDLPEQLKELTEGLSDNQKRQLQEELKNNIIQAAKMSQSIRAGSVPAEILQIVENWVNPKIDWRKLLTSAIQNAQKNDYTFMYPGRRTFIDDTFYYPSQMREPTYRLGICLDESGSITDEDRNAVLSEVKGLMYIFPSWEITIWSFDHKCYEHSTFSDDEPDAFNEYIHTKLKGGGGTHIGMNWDYIKEKEFDFDTLLIFTDTYGNMNGCDPGTVDETIWITKNAPKKWEPPFGLHARYEDAV